MKQFEKEMFDAIRAGDMDAAQWILNHQKVRVNKQTSPGVKTPYASTINGTVIMEHLGLQPGSGHEPTYLIADTSILGQVTLTADNATR